MNQWKVLFSVVALCVETIGSSVIFQWPQIYSSGQHSGKERSVLRNELLVWMKSGSGSIYQLTWRRHSNNSSHLAVFIAPDNQISVSCPVNIVRTILSLNLKRCSILIPSELFICTSQTAPISFTQNGEMLIHPTLLINLTSKTSSVIPAWSYRQFTWVLTIQKRLERQRDANKKTNGGISGCLSTVLDECQANSGAEMTNVLKTSFLHESARWRQHRKTEDLLLCQTIGFYWFVLCCTLSSLFRFGVFINWDCTA